MSLQLDATGSFSDSSTSDVTLSASSYVSSDSTVLVVDGNGRLTYGAGGQVFGGTAGVTGTFTGGVTGSTSVQVVAAESGSQLVPNRDVDWTALGISPWGAYGGLQEASGSNPVLSGSSGYTMTATAGGGSGVAYRAANDQWVRAGVGLTASAGSRVVAAAGTGPNPATDSVAVLAYGRTFPSAVGLGVVGLGTNAAPNRVLIESDAAKASTAQLTANLSGVLVPLVGPLSQRHDDRVHPMLVVYNRTTGDGWTFSDNALAMSGALGAMQSAEKGLNPVSTGAPASASFTFVAVCTGSVAESYSSVSGAADLMSRLGWTVAWKDCPKDSGSIYCPFLPSHWAQLGLPAWTAVWNCQDVAGALGSFDRLVGTSATGYSLAVGGAVGTYQVPKPGWRRTALSCSDASGGRWTSTLGVPTGSAAFAFLAYAQCNQAGGANHVGFGATYTSANNRLTVDTGTTGTLGLFCSGSVVYTAAARDYRDGRVHPILAVYDPIASRAKLYTDLETVTGTFHTLGLAGGALTPAIGLNQIQSTLAGAGLDTVYLAMSTGTVAQNLSDDGQALSFLKTMGWNPGQSPLPPKNLVAVMGQSNAIGVPEVSGVTNWSAVASGYNAVQLIQHIENPSDPTSWVDFSGSILAPRQKTVVGLVTGTFGVELSMGRILDVAATGTYSGSIVIGKIAVNSSGLQAHWRISSSYPTSPANGPNLFLQSVQQIQNYQAQYNNATLRAIVWIQGEEDAKAQVTASLYRQNLTDLVAGYRGFFPNVAFVYNRLSSQSPEADIADVRYGQDQLALSASNVTEVNCDDLAMVAAGNAHFNPNSVVTLGIRFANAIATSSMNC